MQLKLSLDYQLLGRLSDGEKELFKLICTPEPQSFFVPFVENEPFLFLARLYRQLIDPPYRYLSDHHLVQRLLVDLDHKHQLCVHCGVHEYVAVVVVYSAVETLQIQPLNHALD